MPPPHHDRNTAKAIKISIAKAENINDDTNTSLFLTPYSQLPMGRADRVNALNLIASGPGSTPQDPLAFVAEISGSALESDGRGRLQATNQVESAADPDTPPDSEIRYRTSIRHCPSFLFLLTFLLLREVYYLLYDNYEIPSKVAFDPEQPSLGRIRVDSVTPPHNYVTIKRCISRVEKTLAIAYAYLFADISCNTPLKEDNTAITFLRGDYPGLSPKEPMAIVLNPIPDGKYLIRNRAAPHTYWEVWGGGESTQMVVRFDYNTAIFNKHETTIRYYAWDITHDTNHNILMSFTPSRLWVGAEITASKVPVPWQLIQVDSKFY